MSYSYTTTNTATESFTLTHAKYLASKVTADMVRCQQLYGLPTDPQINIYGTELALLLRDGHVSEYEFGFKKGDQRLVSWKYTVVGSSLDAVDDRPGKMVSGVKLESAAFFNFLSPSSKWFGLSSTEREAKEKELPFRRSEGSGPQDGLGYWAQDLSYSSTGITLGRKTFRPFSI
jgi:hypothetical protein